MENSAKMQPKLIDILIYMCYIIFSKWAYKPIIVCDYLNT